MLSDPGYEVVEDALILSFNSMSQPYWYVPRVAGHAVAANACHLPVPIAAFWDYCCATLWGMRQRTAKGAAFALVIQAFRPVVSFQHLRLSLYSGECVVHPLPAISSSPRTSEFVPHRTILYPTRTIISTTPSNHFRSCFRTPCFLQNALMQTTA